MPTPRYVPQPTSELCQSACIAMVLNTSDVYGVRLALEKIADSQGAELTGTPSVMGEYLASRVKSYDFLFDGSLNDAKKALSDGCCVITHGWFTHPGHVVLLHGVEPDARNISYRFRVHDPNGEYDFLNGVHNTSLSGANVKYSSYGTYATCVASSDYSHARDIYASRSLDSNLKNAWLHIIKP